MGEHTMFALEIDALMRIALIKSNPSLQKLLLSVRMLDNNSGG
jgi:hypothetical protein